LVGYSLKQ